MLQRRHVTPGFRQEASARNSTESDETLKEQVIIVGDDYEKPQKEMDFPSVEPRTMSSNHKTRNNLRINTLSKTEMHDRYMSSEEEPSPSPDSEKSHDEELKHKSSVRFAEEPSDMFTTGEGQAEIAIAVPILCLGRPKLVDITNLAPIHKRKQRIPKSQVLHTASKVRTIRIPVVVDENTPFPAHEAAEVVTSPPVEIFQAPKRRVSRPSLTATASWLPDDETLPSDDEHYFPKLDVRRTPSYRDYDPYSLEPPRLTAPCKVSRARGSSGSPSANLNPSSWKGLTRSLSLAKKQSNHLQVAKKMKMVARGANEREEMLAIPPFRFEDCAAERR